MRARVRVAILNYNGGALVVEAVEAALATDWPSADLDVMLIDNASTDGSVDEVARRFPSVSVVRESTNRGFPANNRAFQDLDSVSYVALLNPDTVCDRGWLRPLVDALVADERLGAACPVLVYAVDRDRINSAGVELLADGYARNRLEGEARQRAAEIDVFAWSGGAVLLRGEYLRRTGSFDEQLFLYYEDVDLSWRGARLGWRYRVVPESVVVHHHAATVGVGSRTHRYYSERNRLLVLVKNAPFGFAARAILRFPLSTLSIAFRGEGWRVAALRARSYAGFLRLLPHALSARRRIGRGATVSDGELVRDLPAPSAP